MSNAPVSLAARLGSVRVGVRADLEVTRHVFRGRPSYVVRDPLSFQSHRFDNHDYEVLMSLSPSRSLSETFQELVQRGRATAAQEEQFYQFVYSLHRHAFLHLPVSDEKTLYRRFRAHVEAGRKRIWSAILSYQLPIWNPDPFLDRTGHLMRWPFTKTFFFLWTLLASAALWVAFQRRTELIEPLNGILAATNLPVMWGSLVVLKAIHEFGHAFACRKFGVHVPEMGLNFIVGTPCAYVDASGSWQLPRKSHRIIICLAGMYFESIVASLAVFVWAATDQGLLNSIAYNVMFLASTITLLFNINPLMRFDGYYIASDLLEIPNLRQQSSQRVFRAIKRRLLGVQVPPEENDTLKTSGLLLGFGVASMAYRVSVTIGIIVILAMKLSLIGLSLGLFFALAACSRSIIAILRYLLESEETRPVRGRSVGVALCTFVGIPLLCGLIPVPNRVAAKGVLKAEQERTLRAAVPGFVRESHLVAGETVEADAVCFDLENTDLHDALADANARRDEAIIRSAARLASDLVRSRQEAEKAKLWQSEADHRAEQVRSLRPTAPIAGKVVETLSPRDIGRYLPLGAPLATIVSGENTVRVLLDEKQIAACAPRLGDSVEFRSATTKAAGIPGVISHITPAGTQRVEYAALTHQGGGSIVVNPADSKATQRYYEIAIHLNAGNAELPRGATGTVLFTGPSESLGRLMFRRFATFLDRVLRN